MPRCITPWTRSPLAKLGVLAGWGFGLFGAIETTRAAEELWKNCSTTNTDYVLQIPGSLVHSPEATATGCTYQTSDGEFTVEAVEQSEKTDQEQSLAARMQKEIDLMAGTVTYQTKGDSWFVLSGITADGTEYYRKHSTNGTQWVTLRITYPHSKHKKYDKWVTRIEKSFAAFGRAKETPSPAVKETTSESQDSGQ